MALSARTLSDSIGVNIHPDHVTPSPYADTAKVNAALAAIGIKHVRGSFIRTDRTYIAGYATKRLAATEARVNLLIDTNSYFADMPVQALLDAIRTQVPNIESLELPNENQPAYCKQVADYVYAAAKADPYFRDMPIYGPSFINQGDYATWGTMTGGALSDAYNLHDYLGHFATAPLIEKAIKYGVKAQPDGKPGIVTEFGFHGPRQCGGMDVREQGTSQTVQVRATEDVIRAPSTGLGLSAGDKIELTGNLAGTGLDQPDRLIEGTGRGWSYYVCANGPLNQGLGQNVTLSREPFGPAVDVTADAIATKWRISGHPSVPPVAAQRWLIDQCLEHLAHGINRSYVYALFRENRNCMDGEFGIVDNDGTLTPPAITLSNWLALLADDDPPPAGPDQPLTIMDPSGITWRMLQFRKHDGSYSYWAALWPSKETTGRRTLTLSRPAGKTYSWQHYKPSEDRAMRSRVLLKDSYQVPDVGNDPILVRFAPR